MIAQRPQIALLLCTYNGAQHVRAQLDSLRIPRQAQAQVYVSDDGSTDTTLDVLGAYQQAPGSLPLMLRAGPRRGHALNFLSLLCADEVQGDVFAFCDQDDIWDPDKLDRALSALATVGADTPAIYCSRTRAIDDAGRVLGESPLFRRPTSFANALVHNIAGGNTMVLNGAARDLACRAGPVDVITHDWWLYQLVTGAGGVVLYDSRPSLGYRQHRGNAIGANLGLRARLARYSGFLGGRNRHWNSKNLAALRCHAALLTGENRRLLADFVQLHNGGLIQRLRALQRGGFYAQTASGNIGLWCATLLKKI